jgi:hypothetical protein
MTNAILKVLLLTVAAALSAEPGAMFETIDKFITGNPLGPKSRDLVSSERLTHEDGNRQMTTPTYAIDISLRIKRLQ